MPMHLTASLWKI